MYQTTDRPLRQELIDAHRDSWAMIAGPGAVWTGPQRVAFVAQARAALTCELCEQRKTALSPFSITGVHQGPDLTAVIPDQQIAAAAQDVCHRLATDPGRLTHAWFESLTEPLPTQNLQGTGPLSVAAYVELVSVVTSSIIIDSQHRAVGAPLPELPEPLTGEPGGLLNPDAVTAGAWVPIGSGDDALSGAGLPNVPNIVRSMGYVPQAVALFFNTFRPHYSLQDIQLDISQAVAEFVASRVSAHNNCFY